MERRPRWWHRIRRNARPRSLRARLVGTLLAVVAVGLGVADLVTWEAVKSFETSRIDAELRLAWDPAYHGYLEPSSFPFASNNTLDQLPADTLLWFVANNGSTVFSGVLVQSGHSLPSNAAPAMPPGVLSRLVAGGPGTQVFMQTSAAGITYRALAAELHDGSGIFVVGIPLSYLQATLAHLALVELLVSVAVLLACALGGLWLIRLGLRPLESMVDTAGQIAEGDLSRRVDYVDRRTEVGRLGEALNTMLSRIEDAFLARQRSEENLRRFLADASHELRTPLTSIRGYAELFRRQADLRPADLEAAMRRIESEAERMSVLVEDMLLLARLDQGRPLESKPVDLTGLAADGVTDLKAADPSRPVSFQASGVVIVRGDEHRLRQVIANLLTNARVHTPPGTPVAVSVRAEPPWAVLEVSDQGPGIEPEDLQRVFERFYRADRSRQRGGSFAGAGLGLSIVAAIVAAHSGEVSAYSETGKGATFTVKLPLGSNPPPSGGSTQTTGNGELEAQGKDALSQQPLPSGAR
jgi:two-component system OmpR family sensor kinase